ncbi:MAG: hypothetical protein ACJ73J_02680 [Actinomycetes bacterium]
MPRADHLSLTADGLKMPSVDHMSNRGSLNVVLDRRLSTIPGGLPKSPMLVGLFTNFVRLTDKALREYDAARAELLSYLEHSEWLQTGHYLRAIDHMENCASAIHRAVLNSSALRQHKIGRSGPQLTDRQETRLRELRNAIEHSDEKLLGKQYRNSPPFASREPYSLRLANTSMVIGGWVLTYRELVSVMTKMYRTIEAIRGVSTGTPGPDFPNSRLRTEVRAVTASSGLAWRPSEYLRELSRLSVTH